MTIKAENRRIGNSFHKKSQLEVKYRLERECQQKDRPKAACLVFRPLRAFPHIGKPELFLALPLVLS